MVRIGTPINKPTPQSIVNNSVSFFFPLSVSFYSIPFVRLPFPLADYSVSLSPCTLPFVVPPRPRKANKPSNSSGILRDSATASNQQQVPCSYIPRVVFPSNKRSYFCKLLARSYAHVLRLRELG